MNKSCKRRTFRLFGWIAANVVIFVAISGKHGVGQSFPTPAVALSDIKVLEPRVGRTEADEDQIVATAHFAEGRLLFRREAYPAALKRYQRAYRYSGNSRTVLDEVVTLSYRLGRLDEATRYAQDLQSGTSTDPFVLRRLAMHLADREAYVEALRLYQLTGATDLGNDSAGLITHFEMGRLNYLLGDFKQSAIHFRRVWDALKAVDALPAAERPIAEALEKEAVTTFSLIAEAFLESGQVDESEASFRRAYKRSANDDILRFHLARVAKQRGKTAAALELLEQYFETKNSDAGTAPYELYVDLLRGDADKDDPVRKAAERLNELKTAQPKNVFLVYFLGELYLKNDQPERALEVFQDLMKIQPLLDGYRGIIRAHYQQKQANAVVIRLAEAATKLGDLSALSEVTRLVGSDDSFWKQMVVWSEDLRKGRIDIGSAKLSSKAVAQVLAEVAAAGGRFGEADRYFEQAVGSADTDRALLLDWGLERLASERPERAAEIFRRLIPQSDEATQDVGLVHYYLSAALAIDDDFDAALDSANTAAKLLPDIPAIQMRPAWVLYLARRFDDSHAAYKSFLERFGDSETDREVIRDVKSSISALAVRMGRYAEAEEWLEQILDEVPGDVGALNDLGYLWADQSIHLQRALVMIQAAVAAEPENRAYRDSLGWVYFRLGRMDEAIVELRNATDEDEPDGVILEHLGDALFASGDQAAAAIEWRKALLRLKDDDAERSRQIELKMAKVVPAP